MHNAIISLLLLPFFTVLLCPTEISPQNTPRVKTGVDVLIEKNINLLKNKRIGLITNQTGRSSELVPTADLLLKHGVNLVVLFAPEHGLRGTIPAGKQVSTSVDSHTGLPVYSLYGGHKRPTSEMLRGLDVLIFDIQDIGVRWYTYISTMALAMEEAAKRNIEFIVLDRPNPLGGLKMEGPVLNPETKSFVGLYPVPVVHGMTIGELAKLYRGEENLHVKLTVVRMEGWNRSMVWGDTGLKWVPTSPQIPTVESAFSYPGMGLIGEMGVVSVGVGYTLPFQVAGASWISSHKLTKKMNNKKLPGVIFRQFRKQKCEGIQIHLTDRKKYMPLKTAMYLIEAIRELYPHEFSSSFTGKRRKSFDRYLGDKISSELIKVGKAAPILKRWQKEINEFKEKRKKYLIY